MNADPQHCGTLFYHYFFVVGPFSISPSPLLQGSIYDRRIYIHSSPLEMIYNMKTINHVMDVFHPPDEVQIAYLQETAIENVRDKVKEVRMTKLGLEFVVANHKFVDVNVRFESSYMVIPLRGSYTTGPGGLSCPCLVANLGSVAIRSGTVTQTMVDSKKNKGKGFDALKRLQDNLLDQAYDKFSISLDHMEVRMIRSLIFNSFKIHF